MLSFLAVVASTISCLWISMFDAAWSIEVGGQIDLLNHSEYCSVNNSVIQNVLDSDELLTIINNTGSWLLVATKDNDWLFIPSNISDCENEVYNPDIVVYAVQTSIYAINFLLATCNIALHLCLKELQTMSGILITTFCIVFNVDRVVTFFHNRYQFTHKVSSDEICAMLVYMRGILTFLYYSTKFTVLFHFTYLMYNSYRVRYVSKRFDAKLMTKYIIYIVSLTTVYSIVLVPYDAAVTRSAFNTKGGYCAIKFLDGGIISTIIFIVQFSVIFVIQFIMFCVGALLYFLVNRHSCSFKSSDIRVCFILVSTAGLNVLFFLVSYFVSDGSSGITFVISSIGTFIEQLLLVIIFATSKKVKRAVISMVTSTT